MVIRYPLVVVSSGIFIALLGAQMRLIRHAPSERNPAPKPNVLVIVADDLGYADLGCQGAVDLRTPYIDRLAAGGVRCTTGYVSAPHCSPSRAGLLTGRHQARFGHEANATDAQEARMDNYGLPLTEKTIADYLRQAGYRTGLVGKWHLGRKPAYYPLQRGFDYFTGILEGSCPYIRQPSGMFRGLLQGEEPAQVTGDYLTDVFTDEAVRFIENRAGKPFFLMVSYNAPHTPMQAPDRYLNRFSHITDPKRRTFAAMMAGLDDGVGRLIETLKNQKIDQNTLIIFVSDNGGPTADNTSLNTPFSGGKASVFEGGLRVPMIWWYPGKLPAGKTYKPAVSSLDIGATTLAMAGVNSPTGKAALDGVDLLPFLSGRQAKPPHDYLLWRWGPFFVARHDNYKLIQLHADSTLTEFYDLAANPQEVLTKQADNPAVRRALEGRVAAWQEQLITPAWGNTNLGPIKGFLRRHGLPGSDEDAKRVYETFMGIKTTHNIPD